jgi:tRNA(Phe) wybutosine-synthesizing methylase Tyw3
MKDPERCENSNKIEKGVSPLVKELNNVDNTRTFGSCQGHFGFEEPEPFNNRAYIEFMMPRGKFGQLEKAIYE